MESLKIGKDENFFLTHHRWLLRTTKGMEIPELRIISVSFGDASLKFGISLCTEDDIDAIISEFENSHGVLTTFEFLLLDPCGKVVRKRKFEDMCFHRVDLSNLLHFDYADTSPLILNVEYTEKDA